MDTSAFAAFGVTTNGGKVHFGYPRGDGFIAHCSRSPMASPVELAGNQEDTISKLLGENINPVRLCASCFVSAFRAVYNDRHQHRGLNHG